MSEQEHKKNRIIVGGTAVACLVGALVMWLTGMHARQTFAFAGMIRVGVFLAVLWMALPSKGRAAAWKGLSPWTIALIVGCVFVIPQFRYSLPLLIGMLALGAFIKPRPRTTADSPRRTIESEAVPPAKAEEDT